MSGPSARVLAAFGVSGPARLLDGGQGRTWLAEVHVAVIGEPGAERHPVRRRELRRLIGADDALIPDAHRARVGRLRVLAR